MDLNDKKIKTIIGLYLSCSSENKNKFLDEFRREVELYVYNFPRMAYRKGLDLCSEFYLYFLDRMDAIIKNFPMGEDLLFKTWFNYVLKNNFLNYLFYQRKEASTELKLEDFENEIVLNVFENEEKGFEGLKAGLSMIEERDRLLIKFYYMPEILSSDEIKKAVEIFHLPLYEILAVQGCLITAHYQEIKRIREISSKIGKINETLRNLKYELYKKSKENNEISYKEKSKLLYKIARYDSAKFKCLRELEIPGRNIFQEFIRLFKDRIQAKNRLSIAEKKLKFEVLKYNTDLHSNVS